MLLTANDSKRFLYELENFIPEAKKILFILSDFTGCGWYRMQTPASYLNKNYSKLLNLIVTNYISFKDLDITNNSIKWNICTFQRQYSESMFEVFKKLKSNNIKCGYELDDNLFTIHPTSPVYNFFTKDILNMVIKFLNEADFVTVSTEPLKDYLKKYNQNIYVLPNFVNTEYLKTYRKKKEDYYKDELIIGWAGSYTHYIDLVQIQDVIFDILNKYKNVKFYLGGWRDCPLFKNINSEQIILKDWYDNILDYYKSLSIIDIGICPLAPIKFNESKSNIKYLEFASLGIPVIASDIYPYKNTIKHGKTGLLISSTGSVYKGWKNALELLINDAKLRHTLGYSGAQFVDNNYDQKIIGKKWLTFYNELC